MVDDFAPPDYMPIGARVNVPVTIRAYSRKGGGAGYGLAINRPYQQGEEF